MTAGRCPTCGADTDGCPAVLVHHPSCPVPAQEACDRLVAAWAAHSDAPPRSLSAVVVGPSNDVVMILTGQAAAWLATHLEVAW